MPAVAPCWRLTTATGGEFSLHAQPPAWWIRADRRHAMRVAADGIAFDAGWPAADRDRFGTGLGLALWLELAGTPCLHANVLARNGRALALLGASGAGKSTLSAYACLRDWRLLSDDMLVLHPGDKPPTVHPGRVRLLLYPDIALALGLALGAAWGGPKQAFEARTTDPAPLAAFVELHRGGAETRLIRLGPAQALTTLLSHGMLADLPRVMGTEAPRLSHLARLAALVPVHRLEYPDGVGQLAGVLQALEALVR